MPQFLINAVWQLSGSIIIEADSLEAAEAAAMDHTTELPDNGSYIEDSFELDKEAADYGSVVG